MDAARPVLRLVSPLPPARGGIADHAAMLLPGQTWGISAAGRNWGAAEMPAPVVARRPGPRVLLVAPMVSHPARQGNSARLAAFGAALRARGAAVELLYYGLDGLSPPQQAAMQAAWDGFHFQPALPHATQKFPGFWGLDDWCPEALRAAVAGLQRRQGFQAVVANYVWLSGVLEGLTGPLKLVDTHDVFGDRHLVAARQGLAPNWYFTSQAEEARGLARADAVLAIQSDEAAVLRQRGAARVLTVGHWPGAETRPEGVQLARFGVLASGNPWNQAAVQGLDAALAGAADVEWLLAGGICSVPGLRLGSAPLRLGAVERVADFYGAVDCVLNPMQGGTGLKVKTVEALAHGMPVMGTADAFAGLGSRHPAQQATDAAALLPMLRDYAARDGFRAEVAAASAGLARDYAAEVAQHYDALMTLIGG